MHVIRTRLGHKSRNNMQISSQAESQSRLTRMIKRACDSGVVGVRRNFRLDWLYVVSATNRLHTAAHNRRATPKERRICQAANPGTQSRRKG